MADKRKVLMTILVIVIIILVAIIMYAFVIKPGVNSYVIKNQNIGYNVGYQNTILTIMQRAASCQPVPLTYGNQTINIIDIKCLQLTQ